MKPTLRIHSAFLAILGCLAVFLTLACANPAAGEGGAPTTLSISLPRVSPVFAELFAQPAGRGLGRALIGATKAEIELYRSGNTTTSPDLSWTIDTPSRLDENVTDLASVKTVASDIGTITIKVRVFNSAYSATDPVATGNGTCSVKPGIYNIAYIYCLPASPVDVPAASGLDFSESLELPHFVLSGSSVSAVGGERWYKFVPSGTSVTIELGPATGNDATAAAVLYNAKGDRYDLDSNYTGRRVSLKATAAAPGVVFASVTPGSTYYIGVGQSGSGTGAKTLAFRLVDGPAVPPAPTATVPQDRPGEVNLSWTCASGMTSYEVYYQLQSMYYGYPTLFGEYPAGTASCVVTGLSPSYPYKFYLKAKNAAMGWTSGEGASAIASPIHPVRTLSDGTKNWTLRTANYLDEGSATFTGGTLSLVAGKKTYGGSTVSRQNLYLPVSGDFTFISHIASVSSPKKDAYSSASGSFGVSLRDAMDSPSEDISTRWYFSTSDSGTTLNTQFDIANLKEGGGFASFGAPPWLKVQRAGTTITLWTSSDGVAWTKRQFSGSTGGSFDGSISSTPLQLAIFIEPENWNNPTTVNFDTLSLVQP